MFKPVAMEDHTYEYRATGECSCKICGKIVKPVSIKSHSTSIPCLGLAVEKCTWPVGQNISKINVYILVYNMLTETGENRVMKRQVTKHSKASAVSLNNKYSMELDEDVTWYSSIFVAFGHEW